MDSGFIIYNGKLIEASTPLFTLENRSFKYGDGIFEAIRIVNSAPLYFEEHYSRLVNGSKIIKLKLPENFSKETLDEQINKLIEKNKIKEGGRIKLTLFRDSAGLYTPENNTASYCIEIKSIADNLYSLNSTGLSIDVFNDYKKPANQLSNIKSNNALMYVLATLDAKEQKVDDCLILNEYGNIAEATSSNIFLVKKDECYTPPLSEGCVDGVMRRIILKSYKSKFNITEKKISVADLQEADEVFITNTISGIKWVGFFKEKKYTNEIAKQLLSILNKRALNCHSSEGGNPKF